jgi:GNAT superfamily N-acetyltransferase
VPELTALAEVDGRPIAAVFGLLDYNPRIKKIDGRLFPFGFLRLLWNRRSIKRVRLLSTNVLPEYQRWGVGLVAMARILPDSLKWGIQEAEFSWVLESNHLSYKTLKRGGARLTKTYRIYDYDAHATRPRGDTPQALAAP